jgi:hypothetical protein
LLTLAHDTVIRRRADEIFAVAVVPENQHTWDPAGPIWVEKLDDKPLGLGSHYRGRWRRFGRAEWTFIAFDPPREFGHDARAAGIRMVHRLRFDDDGDGTRFRQTLEVTPPLILERLLAPVFRTALRRRLVQLGEELKEYMERPAA